ncbi:cyclin-dependent protein kinase regulator Pho80 [Coprinopsis sp. MPI-PUGE-AT-0042]|nr:cyclin-dependent protein kinase regulator Pho80 [Coprinopsis sp. MPI-PUGE-AT-0042]
MASSSSGRVELPPNLEDVPIECVLQLIDTPVPASADSVPLETPPSITVLDYLKRIVRFTNVEKSCLFLILVYIDQICARKPLFTFSSLTAHRFIIVSITVASKGLCDVFSPNKFYARVGGIPVTELNTLEREFLSMIEWRLMSTRHVLQEYYVNLVRTHSTGAYVIVGTDSPASSDSDIDMDSSGQSAPPSPSAQVRRPQQQRAPSEPSHHPG